MAVAGLDPAARAQAVAVQRRPDQVAVGGGDDGGAVPRLHEARVVLVEAAHLGAHEVLAALVGLGDHHHQRVRERAPRELQQLDHVVERGRVRVARLDDRRELLEVVAEQLRLQRGLARAHPVLVAHERVDLAVVGDEPVRVRERPAREGVGREARVHERQRRRRPLVAQVGEERRELVRDEHALVDHRARGHRRDVDVLDRGLLDQAADHVELALDRKLVGERVVHADEQLLDGRRHGARGRARLALVDRHTPPAQRRLALGRHHGLDERLEVGALDPVAGQEADGDAVAAALGQLEVHAAAQQRVGHLHEQPGAVAGGRIGAGGAAVLEVGDHGDAALHHLVGGPAVQARDEGDAAGVVLVAGVVEA